MVIDSTGGRKAGCLTRFCLVSWVWGIEAEGIPKQVVNSELRMRLEIGFGGKEWRAKLSILSTFFSVRLFL